MPHAFKIVLGMLGLAFICAALATFAWRLLKRSDDPLSLVTKWVLSVIGFVLLIYIAVSLGPFAPIGAAIVGVLIGIMWAPNIAGMIANPLAGLYDGGKTEVEPRPFYSIARAKKMRGNYPEAIGEARRQLERFPEDYEGWMLLAELYGDDLKDNQNAQMCVTEILIHEGHAPRNVAYALNRSADWHLNLASDRDGARAALERIVHLFPDSEFSHVAAQRIAHLTPGHMLAEAIERPKIKVTAQTEHIGLRRESPPVQAKPEEDPAQIAARLVEHLNEHPLDAEAREQLAKIYAEHYQRMDLATDQVEQLIAAPGVSQKNVARFLNFLADLHLGNNADETLAKAALNRLIELFPNTAVAANAEKRIAYIHIEVNRNKKSQVMQLGSYETNIGLKGRTPKPPEPI